MKKLFALVIAATFVMPLQLTVAQDDDPLLAAVKARKSYMQVVKWNAGKLFAMAKGDMEYDAELAEIFAANLNAVASMKNSSMWPEGSDNVKYEGETRALPEIWTTYPKVGDANQRFADAAAALATVAGSGLDQLREKVGDLGKSCKGCHDDFRAEDN